MSEPSAIHAGDAGFAVNVAGNTTLTGGQITSSAQAVHDSQNRFHSASALNTSDIPKPLAVKLRVYMLQNWFGT